jgi:hypothetical protein
VSVFIPAGFGRLCFKLKRYPSKEKKNRRQKNDLWGKDKQIF